MGINTHPVAFTVTHLCPCATTDPSRQLLKTKYQTFLCLEYLQLSAEQRRASYNENKLLQEHAVWVNGFNGKLDRINDKQREIENSIYTRQACIPWMGNFFFLQLHAVSLTQQGR